MEIQLVILPVMQTGAVPGPCCLCPQHASAQVAEMMRIRVTEIHRLEQQIYMTHLLGSFNVQHLVGDPLAEHTEHLQICWLLATAKKNCSSSKFSASKDPIRKMDGWYNPCHDAQTHTIPVELR